MGSHPHNRHLQHSNNVSICCTLIGFPLERLYLLCPCAICSVSSALEIRIYKWQTRRWWQFSRSCCVLVRFLWKMMCSLCYTTLFLGVRSIKYANKKYINIRHGRSINGNLSSICLPILDIYVFVITTH